MYNMLNKWLKQTDNSIRAIYYYYYYYIKRYIKQNIHKEMEEKQNKTEHKKKSFTQDEQYSSYTFNFSISSLNFCVPVLTISVLSDKPFNNDRCSHS